MTKICLSCSIIWFLAIGSFQMGYICSPMWNIAHETRLLFSNFLCYIRFLHCRQCLKKECRELSRNVLLCWNLVVCSCSEITVILKLTWKITTKSFYHISYTNKRETNMLNTLTKFQAYMTWLCCGLSQRNV